MAKQYGPWKIVSSEVKYKNYWLTLTEDKVIRPDGKDGVYAYMKIIPGVAVLALDDEGFAYLTEEFHYAIGKVVIEAVAGGADEGEKPVETAKRELKEELGIEAEQWSDLGPFDPLTSFVDSPMRLFLARKLKFSAAKPDGVEVIKLLKVPFTEAVQMAMSGKITTGSSIAVILKAKLFLEREK